MKYNWREEYYNIAGVALTSAAPGEYNVKYLSHLSDGDGSKEHPASTKDVSTAKYGVGKVYFILNSGYSRSNIKTSTGQYENAYFEFIGNTTDLKDTYLSANAISVNSNEFFRFKNLQLSLDMDFRYGSTPVTLYNCDIKKLNTTGGIDTIRYCIDRVGYYVNDVSKGFSNSCIGTQISDPYRQFGNLNLFKNCNIIIPDFYTFQRQSNYCAFDDCNFSIGAESGFTPLNGNTEEELRADFVTRCTAQGFGSNIATYNEFGEQLKAGRWVFARNSSIEGVVLPDSIIHNFEKKRLIYFGYTSLRDGFSVSANNKKNSFHSGNPNQNFEFADNSLSLPADFDIADKKTAIATSNIMWLGGKKAITKLDINHNFPKEYGVALDSTPTLGTTDITAITMKQDGTPNYYIVRSKDDSEATATYNSAVYSSSLTNRNNIIKSVENISAYGKSPNAEVFQILDEIQYQTIQIRIVNKIPTDIITPAKALVANYWYLVEHDSDQSNTTDYVLYNGKKYYVGDSLLASSASFTASGNVHLRRCWNHDFTSSGETLDQNFWMNEQKPEWIDIVPDDPRCLMKNNNPKEIEMQKNDGKYIASGHPDFYKRIMTDKTLPTYPIKGTYMQVRILLTTQNPM